MITAPNSLIDRAKELGANGPHCYLFPFHVTQGHYDALRPMSVWGLRLAWDEARRESGLPWLRVYDLRHTAITRMAEAGVPIQVIMSFAGHISPRMQQHYTGISMEAKRRWAAVAWSSGSGMQMDVFRGEMGKAGHGEGRWVWEPAERRPVASVREPRGVVSLGTRA
jgi:hypothetical protein